MVKLLNPDPTEEPVRSAPADEVSATASDNLKVHREEVVRSPDKKEKGVAILTQKTDDERIQEMIDSNKTEGM